jgi:predicted RNA binding protein YcfA (HicA-like mRNA interferase family)
MKRAKWKELVAVCELVGWVEDRIKGDHFVMTKAGTARPVVIKMDKNLGEDLIQSVKKSAGLTTQEFHALLDQVRNKAPKRKRTSQEEPASERPN